MGCKKSPNFLYECHKEENGRKKRINSSLSGEVAQHPIELAVQNLWQQSTPNTDTIERLLSLMQYVGGLIRFHSQGKK